MVPDRRLRHLGSGCRHSALHTWEQSVMVSELPAGDSRELSTLVGWLSGLKRAVANRLGVLSRRPESSNLSPTVFLTPAFFKWLEAYWRYRANQINAYARGKGCDTRVTWFELMGVWARADGTCRWCDERIALGTKRGGLRLATIEHLVPLNCGGDNGAQNLDFACRSCNETRIYRPKRANNYRAPKLARISEGVR